MGLPQDMIYAGHLSAVGQISSRQKFEITEITIRQRKEDSYVFARIASESVI
jgi:hypothetical protein